MNDSIELFLDRADVIQIKDPANLRKFIFLSQNEKAPLTRREQDIIKTMLIAQYGKSVVFEFRVGCVKPILSFLQEDKDVFGK